MSRNTLTTVKADARIQRCAINDPFKNYKPESEQITRKFEVKESKALKQLKDTFLDLKKYDLDYDEKAAAIASKLRPSSRDIMNFSMVLAEFQNIKEFSRQSGLFMNALMNSSKDTEFTVVTQHLDMPVNYLCQGNKKNVIVEGDVWGWFGQGMEKGTTVVKGNAGMALGEWMRGGTIIVEGNVTEACLGKEMSNGKIIVKGNVLGEPGHGMWNGEIHIQGECEDRFLKENRIGGSIYHKGKLIVKNGKFIEK